MINIGHINALTVGDAFPFGYQLHAQNKADSDEQTVLYPIESAPDSLKKGDFVDVFVGTDQQGQLIAFPSPPRLLRDQVGVLTAVSVTGFGAFFEWGDNQDLLVPSDYQASTINTGMRYVVYVFFDEKTQRLLGATKLHRFFKETSAYVTEGQEGTCLVYAKTDLGFKVVFNNQVLGLIFHSDAITSLNVGDEVNGFVKHIREDGKLDIALQRQDQQGRDALQQAILDDLHAHGGLSTLTDKSRPDDIFARFSVSKGAYKKALGALFKRKLIVLSTDCIRLADGTK